MLENMPGLETQLPQNIVTPREEESVAPQEDTESTEHDPLTDDFTGDYERFAESAEHIAVTYFEAFSQDARDAFAASAESTMRSAEQALRYALEQTTDSYLVSNGNRNNDSLSYENRVDPEKFERFIMQTAGWIVENGRHVASQPLRMALIEEWQREFNAAMLHYNQETKTRAANYTDMMILAAEEKWTPAEVKANFDALQERMPKYEMPPQKEISADDFNKAWDSITQLTYDHLERLAYNYAFNAHNKKSG
jgi:hypothetical protein